MKPIVIHQFSSLISGAVLAAFDSVSYTINDDGSITYDIHKWKESLFRSRETFLNVQRRFNALEHGTQKTVFLRSCRSSHNLILRWDNSSNMSSYEPNPKTYNISYHRHHLELVIDQMFHTFQLPACHKSLFGRNNVKFFQLSGFSFRMMTDCLFKYVISNRVAKVVHDPQSFLTDSNELYSYSTDRFEFNKDEQKLLSHVMFHDTYRK